MVRQFHRDPASLPLATFLLQFLVLGLNHLANIHDFLTVELDIFKEQVHLVESVHGSRILQDVCPVSDNVVLYTLTVISSIITCQKHDKTELNNHHEECNQKAESAEVL